MSEHTSQHRTDPAHPVGPHTADPTLIDQIAGDPPVPITVWRTAHSPADAGRSISTRLAYRLVAAYTRRYDLNPLVGRILGVVGIITFTPIAYVVAWILMPADAETDATPAAAAAA